MAVTTGIGWREGSIPTLNVLDCDVLYLLWVMQEGLTQDVDGTQVSELPVSKQPVNCLGGVPSWNTPKYCKGTDAQYYVKSKTHGTMQDTSSR